MKAGVYRVKENMMGEGGTPPGAQPPLPPPLILVNKVGILK